MTSELTPNKSVQEQHIRKALNAHWQASAAGDADAEHDNLR